MEDITIIPHPKKILYIGYNYNSSYFFLGTDVGFQVHQSYPLALKFSRILNGGIGLVQVLNKSNIFCLVGGGESPKYAPNKLLIWDDKKGKEIYEFRFSSFVSNCFIKTKYIFVFCKDSINIISMKTMKIIKEIATKNNPEGIGTISSNKDKYILGWPNFNQGEIEVKDFFEIKNNVQSSKIKAHSNDICCIKINNDGTKIASSSINGTIIRIFDINKKKMIHEFKRGNGTAKIYSINFSEDNNLLAVTSDHAKAYIFLINKEVKKALSSSNEEKKSVLQINKKEEKDNKELKINLINEDKDSDENDDDEKEFNIKLENDKNNDNDENFEVINNELTKSDFTNKEQKSIFRGMSQIIGLSNIFQKGQHITFKIPTKKQSYISFLNGQNNKPIVVDQLGNYTIAEITSDKEAKIIKRDLLIDI